MFATFISEESNGAARLVRILERKMYVEGCRDSTCEGCQDSVRRERGIIEASNSPCSRRATMRKGQRVTRESTDAGHGEAERGKGPCCSCSLLLMVVFLVYFKLMVLCDDDTCDTRGSCGGSVFFFAERTVVNVVKFVTVFVISGVSCRLCNTCTGRFF